MRINIIDEIPPKPKQTSLEQRIDQLEQRLQGLTINVATRLSHAERQAIYWMELAGRLAVGAKPEATAEEVYDILSNCTYEECAGINEFVNTYVKARLDADSQP